MNIGHWNTRSAALMVLQMFLLSAGLPAQTPPAPSGAVAAARPEQFVTLKGSTHPLAQPRNDAGVAPDGLPMERMLLVLQRSAAQEAELRRLLEAQHTQGSPAYHQWLTPQEFGRRFGPADSDLQAITSWLASSGFRVERLAAGRTVLEFSGTAGQVRRALRTEMHKYVVDGAEHWANAGDPQIPASLAPMIAGIVSLHNFPRKAFLHGVGAIAQSRPQPPATGPLIPEFTFPASGCTTTGNCFAVGPQDFAVIYNVVPLWAAGIDGTGQTIAIASESNIRVQDTRDFRSVFGLPAKDPVVILDGPDPGRKGIEEVEANLEVQWAGAVAKNASINLVVSQSTTTTRGVDLSAIYIVDNNLASILNDGFGECEPALGAGGNAFYMFLWEQAAVQGITVVAPTGDTGSAGCDSSATEVAATHRHAVNGVASTPFNVAVGGTDFDQVGNWATYWNSTNTSTTLASAKSYIPETTWNDTCAENGVNGCATVSPTGSDLTAGGGGPSTYYNKPAWQTGAGVPPDGVRDVPDVALFASDGNNGSFYVICQSDAFTNTATSCDPSNPAMDFVVVGGTSGAAASFAGLMALVNQKTASRQGNANFVLYPLAAKIPTAFHDVTKGSNSVACVAGSPDCSNTVAGSGYGVLLASKDLLWPALPGYDLVTGLGSVDANALVQNWSSITFQPTTTTLTNFSPTSLTHGQSVSFQINVTSASGTPTGDIALMVTPSMGAPFAADFFTLSNGAISSSTTFLPGGSYNVFAHYAGDGTFGASDSAGIQVTVGAEANQTVISTVVAGVCQPSGVSVPYGSSYAVRFDVNLSGNACTGVNVSNSPTGTVMTTDHLGTFGSGTYSLNSRGFAEDTSAFFPAGTYFVTAAYSGDASYGPSTSSMYMLTISQASTTTSLASSATNVSAGTNVTLTATVNTQSSAAAPFGTVTFMAGTTPIGTANVVAGTGPGGFVQGTATLIYSLTATVSITASYAGNSNYLTSVSAPVMITSGSADFTPTGPASPVPVTASQSGSAMITVTPAFGFTGMVTINCPSSLPQGLSCAVSPSTLNVGSTAVTATVTFGNVAGTAMAKSLPFQTPGQSPSIPGLMMAGFMCLPVALVIGRRKGARCGLPLLALGMVLGLSSCASDQGNSSVPIVTLQSTSPKAPAGSPVTLNAFVAVSHNVLGSVTFSDAGTPLGAPVPLTAGRASLTTNPLGIGFHSLSAAYGGDSATPAATSAPLVQVMTGTASLQIQLTSGSLSHSLAVPFAVQ